MLRVDLLKIVEDVEAAIQQPPAQHTETPHGRIGHTNDQGKTISNPHAFVKWFAGSHAGTLPESSREVKAHVQKPRVFYHGTDATFDEFQPKQGTVSHTFGSYKVDRHGFFFATTPEMAEAYASMEGVPVKSARIIPAYLRVTNPLYLDDEFSEENEQKLEGAGVNMRWMRTGHTWEKFDGEDGAFFVGTLKKLGFDGAVFTEANPNTGVGGQEVWVVFDPKQIKSAIGAKTFNPNSAKLTEGENRHYRLSKQNRPS